MRFPKTESKIIALAQKIINGLEGNPNFPDPPISPSDLQARLDKTVDSSDAQVMALAAAKQATDTKQADFDDMMTDMKTVLHYAEDTVHDDDAKLSELGWGGRSAPHALQVPGQPRLLEAQRQGAGWLTLDWKKPADGGASAPRATGRWPAYPSKPKPRSTIRSAARNGNTASSRSTRRARASRATP